MHDSHGLYVPHGTRFVNNYFPTLSDGQDAGECLLRIEARLYRNICYVNSALILEDRGALRGASQSEG
jgi:hypothetical protein